jgi:hypothetical protein
MHCASLPKSCSIFWEMNLHLCTLQSLRSKAEFVWISRDTDAFLG